MLGWVNQSIEAFITTTFGPETWKNVVEAAGVQSSWVSSCPYSDKITYDLVITAAGILGVSVNDALEAYGQYFIQHVQGQGYTKLMQVLGANLAEFLQNLNNLHLHLSYCWPEMMAPAFRCEQVTPESLLLHYNSMRPGLWPIVVGVLKGVATVYFNLQLEIELLHSRHAGDCDHEVFKLRYPYQEGLRNWGDTSAAAQSSIFSMSAPLFYTLHPFHMIMDDKMQLLQWGPALDRAVPGLQVGQYVRTSFKCKHPGHVQFDYQQICLHTNNSFVLQARNSVLALKGQMLPTVTQLSGKFTRVLVYLASPRVRSVQEMQQSGIYWSDIPLHDMTQDYILLAEQRHAEADLKEKYEKLTLDLKAANEKLAHTTAYLEEEKARAEALLYRMSGLIACFPCGAGENPQQLAAMAECQSQAAQLVGQQTGSLSSGTMHSSALDRIEAVRQELTRANISTSEKNQVQCLELLGQGTYGKVYKGLWKGSIVAVKTIVLPSAMSGQEKREKMAIMEAAISSALSHPNIMQTYTYDIKPIKDNSRGSDQQLLLIGSTTTTVESSRTGSSRQGLTVSDPSGNVHSFEVRLICEYCDRGTLREALDLGAFRLPDGGVNYPAVLDTAIEITTAILHLHQRNVLHSDLKARNIMLKSSGSEGRGATAKVADFGLAVKMDHMETHLSNAFQGTMTHMAPEIMIKGHVSKDSDVYALGMVLWELYTAKHVFRGIPRALLGHQITLQHKRPEFPPNAPEDYVKLTQQCWDPQPYKRPSLETVLEVLQAARAALRSPTQPLAPYDIESHLTRKHSRTQSLAPKAATQAKGSQESRVPRNSNIAFHSNLREQELKRLEQQQQQRLTQQPQRVLSTRSLGSHSPKQALHGRQHGQGGTPTLRTVVSDADAAAAAMTHAWAGGGGVSSSTVGTLYISNAGVSSSKHLHTAAARADNPSDVASASAGVPHQQGSNISLASVALAADGLNATRQWMGNLGSACGGVAAAGAGSVAYGAASSAGPTSVLSADLQKGDRSREMHSSEQLGDDDDNSKSFYLEHSASTDCAESLRRQFHQDRKAREKAACRGHSESGVHAGDWQGLLQLQELSCDTMATGGSLLSHAFEGLSAAAAAEVHGQQQQQQQQQLCGKESGVPGALSGGQPGQCPVGHGATVAAATAPVKTSVRPAAGVGPDEQQQQQKL